MSLTTKWNNPNFDPNTLTEHNILSYFCHRSNPFYSTQSNNEKQIMSRNPNMDLTQYQGEEYCLYHAQEPVLFIIVKNRRRSTVSVTPLCFYIIINGEVIQAPDIASVINARMQTSIFHINETFQQLFSKAKHHPSNGTYSWEDVASNTIEERYSNYGNHFQSQNMNMLMLTWMNKFPFGGAPTNAQMNPNQTQLSNLAASQVAVPTAQQQSSNNSSVPNTVVSTPNIGSHTPKSAVTNSNVSQQIASSLPHQTASGDSIQANDASPAAKRPRVL